MHSLPTADPGLAKKLLPISAMTLSGKSILVVEDDKLLSWSLEKSLSKWGLVVHSVYTGAEALAVLENSDIEVFLLDYQLPDVDGLRVARQIRKSVPRAVIFLVTAFQLNELEVDPGLIDAYFNKPVDLQQLQQAISGMQSLSEGPAREGVLQPRA